MSLHATHLNSFTEAVQTIIYKIWFGYLSDHGRDMRILSILSFNIAGWHGFTRVSMSTCWSEITQKHTWQNINEINFITGLL